MRHHGPWHGLLECLCAKRQRQRRLQGRACALAAAVRPEASQTHTHTPTHLHTTAAELLSHVHSSLHSVPKTPCIETSTRPSMGERPPARRMVPSGE